MGGIAAQPLPQGIYTGEAIAQRLVGTAQVFLHQMALQTCRTCQVGMTNHTLVLLGLEGTDHSQVGCTGQEGVGGGKRIGSEDGV